MSAIYPGPTTSFDTDGVVRDREDHVAASLREA